MTSAMPISMPLRILERPGHKNRFFAVCMVMVDAPRLGPCLPAPLRTSRSEPQSTPSLSQKLAPSDGPTFRRDHRGQGARRDGFQRQVNALIALALDHARKHERRDRPDECIETNEDNEEREKR